MDSFRAWGATACATGALLFGVVALYAEFGSWATVVMDTTGTELTLRRRSVYARVPHGDHPYSLPGDDYGVGTCSHENVYGMCNYKNPVTMCRAIGNSWWIWIALLVVHLGLCAGPLLAEIKIGAWAPITAGVLAVVFAGTTFALAADVVDSCGMLAPTDSFPSGGSRGPRLEASMVFALSALSSLGAVAIAVANRKTRRDQLAAALL